MSYPGQFVRLVMIGTLYNDVFNVTLNIVPSALGEISMPPVDTTTLTAVAGDVAAWFPLRTGDGGNGFIQSAKLTSIKLNRIDANGHYVDPIAREHIYPVPINGGFAGHQFPQLTLVSTLGTRLDRGRASKGRVYLPPTESMVPGTDGRISAPFALSQAVGTVNLINRLNARYTLIGRCGVASKAGTGKFEHITKVSVGRVVDTMRSRRNKFIEDYQTTPVP